MLKYLQQLIYAMIAVHRCIAELIFYIAALSVYRVFYTAFS